VKLETHCWIKGTFLVERGLLPKNREYVTSPGVITYEKPKDKKIHYRIYGNMWIILLPFAGLNNLPYYFWNVWNILFYEEKNPC